MNGSRKTGLFFKTFFPYLITIFARRFSSPDLMKLGSGSGYKAFQSCDFRLTIDNLEFLKL